jgi:hypothetical protein
MRTFNFASTIRRVFAIRNNVAAIVMGKRASSHKTSAWHASPSYRLRQAFSRLRFAQRFGAGAVCLDADLMPLSMGFSRTRLQPCSVATQRVCEESVERS